MNCMDSSLCSGGALNESLKSQGGNTLRSLLLHLKDKYWGGVLRHMQQLWEHRTENTRPYYNMQPQQDFTFTLSSWADKLFQFTDINISLCPRYKLMELICYTVMGVFPALVILSMVSPLV